MAKDKKLGGPFVAAALFCGAVSEDSDGVLSAVRIVDEVRVGLPPGAPDEFPSKKNPLDMTLWALIIIRRGDAPEGKHKLRLFMTKPDGKTKRMAPQDIIMPQYPNGAVNVKVKMTLKLYSAGVYWMDVVLGKKRLTRMAFNVLVQRLTVPK